MTVVRKKLIETSLPLDAINAASAREKSIRVGHPSTLHLWWARRPLAAARAVIFSQMVDDPSSLEEFSTEDARQAERERLFNIIRDLVLWENTNNKTVLDQARAEIQRSWERACKDNADNPRAAELFDPKKIPPFYDPFAGGGSLPLEAQRLGLESYASDLNPVAVLINKAMIEIPPKFAGQPPVNPEDRISPVGRAGWPGASGLAADVRYYGQWMRNEAKKQIGSLYPDVEVTPKMASNRPDLSPYVGSKLTVIAWLWARTVHSPNPAFADVEVPLMSSFVLSSKKGNEAYVEPVIDGSEYQFKVRVGVPTDLTTKQIGTKSRGSGSQFLCMMSGTPMPFEYIRSEARCGRIGSRLVAVVAEGKRGRVYLDPETSHIRTAVEVRPNWRPDTELPKGALGLRVQAYGMQRWSDLFTARQTQSLDTLSQLVSQVQSVIVDDVRANKKLKSSVPPSTLGESNGRKYAEAVALYLGLCVSRQVNRSSSFTFWNRGGEKIEQVFARQAIGMVWDYCEANPFSNSSGNFMGQVRYLTAVLKELPRDIIPGVAVQADAKTASPETERVISTDPPYYDNIGYADLSDFFYVWLRRSLKSTLPDLFATVAVPKIDELVATPHRHGSASEAEVFFLEGMIEALKRLKSKTHLAFPVTIYYAYKQSAQRGWETFLEALVQSGFSITGTWPMRTEMPGALKKQKASLASSIVLVCGLRPESAPIAMRRELVSLLRTTLRPALQQLQNSNIAPVDLAQAAIGPGMAAFTRYAKVLDASGERLSVRDALTLINQVLDEVLTEQEGDFDAKSRWALSWYEQYGFSEGEFDKAETLSKAKNTDVNSMKESGILFAQGDRVRLLRPEELADDWNPLKTSRPTCWEMVHHLIRALEFSETHAARIVSVLANESEMARELCYRLFGLADQKSRTTDAQGYNMLVRSWPRLTELARSMEVPSDDLFDIKIRA